MEDWDAIRAHQVKTLTRLVPAAVASDASSDELWLIRLVDQNLEKLCELYVALPPKFPVSAPLCHISKPMCHPWLDHDGITVKCNVLTAWNYQESKLGDAVSAIIREFQSRPLVNFGLSTILGSGSTNSHVGPVRFERILMPSYPSTKGSKRERRYLRENPNEVANFIHSLPEVKFYSELCGSMAESNHDLLKKLRKSEATREELSRTFTAEWESLQILRRQTEEVLEKRDILMYQYSPEGLIQGLRVCIAEQEKKCAALVKALEEGSTEFSKFRVRYSRVRIEMNKNKAKVEKLRKHLNTGAGSGYY